jgi:SAM-dependent methyltransferase
MEQAAELDRGAGVVVKYVNAAAEETGLPAADFDLVTAGQCWHWFDRPRAALEARRVLKTGGRLVIAHFDWIPLPGNMVEATEKLIEKHNPKWKFGGGLGIHPMWPRDMAIAGFKDIETFSFDIDAIYTHEAWRGRIRASAGVGASLTPEAVAVFDDELRAILAERWPEDPMRVMHRVFAAIGVNP